MALILRRRADGNVHVEDPPDDHTFSTRMVGRVAADLGQVYVVLPGEDGPTVYRLVGPVNAEAGNPNTPTVGFAAVRDGSVTVGKARSGGSATSKKVG